MDVDLEIIKAAVQRLKGRVALNPTPWERRHPIEKGQIVAYNGVLDMLDDVERELTQLANNDEDYDVDRYWT